MRMFLSFFIFFPLIVFGKEESLRKVFIELESIDKASYYEIEVLNKKFKTKNQIMELELFPGLYSVKTRSFDKRNVPGKWESFSLIVNYKKPNVIFLNKIYNNSLNISLTEEFDTFKIVYNKEEFKTKNKELNLKIKEGKNEIKVLYTKNGINSDESTIEVESFSKPLESPRINFFDNKIIWRKIDKSKKYIVLYENKEFETVNNFFEIDINKKNKILVKAIGENKYILDSNYSEYNFDPKKEELIKINKHSFYLNYKIGELNYNNSDYATNSTIKFKNISGIGSIGYSYHSKIGGSILLGTGGFILNSKNYLFNEIKTEFNYLYKYSLTHNFKINLNNEFKDLYKISYGSSAFFENKESKNFISLGIEDLFYINQKNLLSSKINLGTNILDLKIQLIRKISPNYSYSAGINYKEYKADLLSIINNYLDFSLIYGWE